MRIKLINSLDYNVIDQFSLDKTLEECVTYLKNKYIGEVVCENGMINFYMRLTKGVD